VLGPPRLRRAAYGTHMGRTARALRQRLLGRSRRASDTLRVRLARRRRVAGGMRGAAHGLPSLAVTWRGKARAALNVAASRACDASAEAQMVLPYCAFFPPAAVVLGLREERGPHTTCPSHSLKNCRWWY
jgi:hypothetical protein